MTGVPPLVRRALEHGLGEPDPAGPLLHALACQRGRARVAGAEIGHVLGAWLVSGLPPGVPAFLVERAAGLRLFADDEAVRVLAGEWRSALASEAPFDLLAVRGTASAEDLLGLLVPGGTAVVLGPAELAHPALSAVSLDPGAVLAVRAL